MAPLYECHLKGNLSHLFYKNSSSYPTKAKASKNCTDQGLRFWEDFTEMKNNKISLDDLLNLYIKNGTINASDVMSSSKEDIMKTIISKIHPYKITKPSSEAKDKRWFTYVADATKPKGRRRVCKNTEGELFEFLLAFYGISNAKLEGQKTFGEIFLEWVDYKSGFIGAKNSKRSRSQSTITRYRREYKKCFCGTTFDKTPVNQITSIQIEGAFKDAIEKYNLSESYLNNVFGYIKNAFTYAFRMRYISINEFAYVDKDKLLALIDVKPPKSTEERILTQSQQKALYEAIKTHERLNPSYVVDLALELAMQTGMRVGEIAALHWSDLHNGYIHIDYSEHRVDYDDHSELFVGEPKNKKHRKFPFNPIIEDIFKRVKSLGRESEFVFTNENGERHTASSISSAAINRGEECGIEKVSIHRIRRTIASELRKNYNIKIVSELMGHLEETDEEYYNYDNSEESEKIDASNSLCSNVLTFQGL